MKKYIVVNRRGKIVQRIDADDWFQAANKCDYNIHSVDIVEVDENDEPVHAMDAE